MFGSPVELWLPATAAAAVADDLWRDLSAIHRQWNAWKPGELYELNRAFRAGRDAAASPALRAVIRQAAVLEQASRGLFNPGIGGLVGTWGFHADVLADGQRPSAASLARWQRAAPSLSQIEERGGRLRSRNPGLQLDLGAYAKGVAIDAALDRLQRQGVQQALLNLGGNLAAMGRPGDRPWRVGVRDPHGSGLLTTLTVDGREAVVTSGSYERYRWLDGERCCHILDPQTGAPAPAFVSVTVVHRSAALADAAATALLVAGPARWRSVAERLGVNQVLVVDRHGRTDVTDTLRPRLQRPTAPV
ncbi:MAG: FAD:protein FMN transferase [Burkholderiaceae bacterium]|nr:FAD:protein FMN transferase [Burkholderiaceae bacterium]